MKNKSTDQNRSRRAPNVLMAAVRECRSALWLVALFSLFINLLVLTYPLYLMQVFDRVLTSGRMETLLFITLIAGIAIGVMGLLEAVRGRILTRVGCWLDRRLTPELTAVSVRAELLAPGKAAHPSRELGKIRNFLSGPGVTALFDLPWTPVLIAVIALMHPWLGLIGAGVALVLFGLAILNAYIARRPLNDAAELATAGHGDGEAAIRNAAAVHALGMLPEVLWRRRLANDRALDAHLTGSDRTTALIGLSRSLRLLSQILMLGAGAFLVLQAELTAGGMIAASILLARALAPVDQAIGHWRHFLAARAAYRHLQALIAVLPSQDRLMTLPPPKGRLSCSGVVCHRPGVEEPILRGIDFTLDAGEGLAIVGPSAAGKSTLCRLLVGAWRPSRGHVRLDGADITALDPIELAPHLGYLPQEVELFSGSVKDNIARLIPDASPLQVVDAAKLTGAHDLILQLPDGYQTEIGAKGHQLTAGQRQRIGLARAMFGTPRLLVLDEPGAHLDGEGEEAMLAAIEQARTWGATVVIVTHQLRLLRAVEKVLWLVDGRVKFFGPSEQLLTKHKAVAQASGAATASPQLIPPRQSQRSVAG